MTDPIRVIRERAADVQTARQHLVYALELAHKQGRSLREIAEAAGMSHEQVRRLIRSDQT